MRWSNETYENFFKKITMLEDIARRKEAQLEINPTEENKRELNKAKESLRQYYRVEEEYWKQKAGMQ